MDLTKSELEKKLIAAMKSALTLHDSDSDSEDDDSSMKTRAGSPPPPTPSEQLVVKLVQNETCFRVVLDDYLVEARVYKGSDTLGDQDQHALVPATSNLILTLADLTNHTWIEFIIKNDGLSTSLWLRTAHIWATDEPVDIELVDNDYKYIVTARVGLVSDNYYYYFKNLSIQTIK